jgi:16S rRNA A1518/A1519 N6-dimethyltransferase RsmA/KsgA/DIM1 with predicted DNA glycosylase/AP lyase activity
MFLQLAIMFGLLIILGSVAWTLFSIAPYLPTRHKDYQRIEALADLKPDDRFIDLGCGFGGLLQHLSKLNQNIYGIELNIIIYLISLVISKKYPQKYHVLFGNAMNIDLSDYSVVYIFAASSTHIKKSMIKKLEKELRPGSRVITYCFPVRSWTPKIVDKPTDKDLSLFLYEL